MSDLPEHVAEELALRDLVHRYADAVSRQDAAAVAATFARDGVWEVRGHGAPRGSAEVAEFFTGLMAAWSTIVHGLLSGQVHLDGVDRHRATGRWYVTEFGQQADGTEARFAGVYHDVYVREEGRWRFAHRRYDSLYRWVGGALSTSPFPADAPPFP